MRKKYLYVNDEILSSPGIDAYLHRHKFYSFPAIVNFVFIVNFEHILDLLLVLLLLNLNR